MKYKRIMSPDGYIHMIRNAYTFIEAFLIVLKIEVLVLMVITDLSNCFQLQLCEVSILPRLRMMRNT